MVTLRWALVIEKDQALHPAFGMDRAGLYEQAKTFVHTHGIGANASIVSLLNAPFELADDPRHARRRGVLSLPGWLAVNAKPNMTSPIHRGVFVREQLLCTALPPPPPEAMVTAPNPDPSLSAREQYEIHRADESCASCHKLIDPVGLVFEHFDEVGEWRDRDNGRPIDSSGEMFGSRDLNGAYVDHIALVEGLAQSEQVHRCLIIRFLGLHSDEVSEQAMPVGSSGFQAYSDSNMSLKPADALRGYTVRHENIPGGV